MGNNPSGFKKNLAESALCPVEQVSHIDVTNFCEKAGKDMNAKFRLLTEAEWEYAYRAGTRTAFYNGDSDDNVGEISQCNRKNTEKVGTKKSNAFGLFDMAGNVWEWCSDWYDEKYYETSSTTDPKGSTIVQLHRAVRGGSWNDGPRYCRAAFRGRDEPVVRFIYLGFRLCLPVP